jgi:hypothetical protein
MIAVIFEAWPQDGHRNEYLDVGAALRPMLTEIDGFILLSGSRVFLIQEKSFPPLFGETIKRLKRGETSSCTVRHRPGRAYVSRDYRLRVAMIIRHERSGAGPGGQSSAS